MIAYTKEALEVHEAKNLLRQAHSNQLLPEAEWEKICKVHPGPLYTPGLFARIGLGLLTALASFACLGLQLMLTDGSSLSFSFFFVAVLSLLALEYFTRVKKHFGSGVDDVLLHSAVIYLASAYATLRGLSSYSAMVFAPLLGSALYAIAATRYLDRLAAALAPVGLWLSVYNAFTQQQVTAWWFFFLLAFLSVLLLFLVKRVRQGATRFHAAVMDWAELAAGLCLYASWHIYTLSETSAFRYGAESAPTIAMMVFSWSWTFLLPLGMIAYGYRRHRVDWLRLGLVSGWSAFYFLQHYRQPFSGEVMSMLVGLLSVVLAGLLLGIFRKPRGRYLFDPQGQVGALEERLQLAALLSLAGSPGAADPGGKTQFGGGNFGGGGAGGNY